MECDVCGSRNVSRRTIEGFLLEECNLCGNLQGDDEAVQRVETMRSGRERGLDDQAIPLVTALAESGCFRVVKAASGDPAANEPPSVLFALTKGDLRHIERLLQSIEMANRETRLRWLIELSLQKEIVYILRPRFWTPPAHVSPDDIRAARRDLVVLGERLRRDLGLSWWKA
mgnify:FL=1